GGPHDVEPGFGGGAPPVTHRVGAGTPSGRSRIWWNSEKIAAFAPMPSASETMATVVTKGVLNRVRKAKRRLVMSTLDGGEGICDYTRHGQMPSARRTATSCPM